MCGIFGYISNKNNCGSYVVSGLINLEYRGYDSFGVALKKDNSDSYFEIIRDVGSISDFDLEYLNDVKSNVGVGHTRWATHGGVSKLNSHPHLSNNEKIVVVHNGIIENYVELKKSLINKGYNFKSQTDSEVIPVLIEMNMCCGYEFFDAFLKTLEMIDGNYSIVAMCDSCDILVGAKKGSPLVVGVDTSGYFVSSDVYSFLKYTNDAFLLSDDEVVVLKKNEVAEFYDLKGNVILKDSTILNLGREEASKDGYPYYMIKEINDQKYTLLRAINQQEDVFLDFVNILKNAQKIIFVGCGTAFNAIHCASYYFSKISKKYVNCVVASEFDFYESLLDENTVIFCVSQSGETADVLSAVNKAKERGCKIVSLVNVVYSSLVRLSDAFIPINCGVEKCVLATKSYTSQLIILVLLAYSVVDKRDYLRCLVDKSLSCLDGLLSSDYINNLRCVADKIKDSKNIFMIGKDYNYPVAMEAALKVKEVTYIHAEGFAAGELKHGSIALIEKGTPCFVFYNDDDKYDGMISSAVEIKSRGGFVIGVGSKNHEVFDEWFFVPKVDVLQPLFNIIPIQIFAYEFAVLLGRNPDKPRNLAKSVTVR
jgi:glutamine---fructose-6-phosphate transaminase (isomerizing)